MSLRSLFCLFLSGSFTQVLLYTVQPVLSKHLRDSQSVVAQDQCLLNTGVFSMYLPFCGN